MQNERGRLDFPGASYDAWKTRSDFDEYPPEEPEEEGEPEIPENFCVYCGTPDLPMPDENEDFDDESFWTIEAPLHKPDCPWVLNRGSSKSLEGKDKFRP